VSYCRVAAIKLQVGEPDRRGDVWIMGPTRPGARRGLELDVPTAAALDTQVDRSQLGLVAAVTELLLVPYCGVVLGRVRHDRARSRVSSPLASSEMMISVIGGSTLVSLVISDFTVGFWDHGACRFELRRWSGTFDSVRELKAAVRAFIDGWNDRCEPFIWTKDADTILAKAKRKQTSNTRH